MSDFRISGVIDADARRFQTTIAGVLKSFGSLRDAHMKTAVSTRELERQTRDLNRALEQQNAQVATLVLNYRALRNATLGLALSFAIAGFRGLVASVGALAGGMVELVQQATKLGGALAVLGGAAIAAVGQGAVVAALGLKDLAKAFQTTGTEHEKALQKLTAPARQFVGQMREVTDAFRSVKLIAQQGLFEGITKGVKAALPVLEPLKQVIYDTAVAMGYLADRAGVLIGSRASDLKAFGERNVVTLRRMGDAALNVGDALLQVARAADPFIGHVSRTVVTLSQTIDTLAIKLRKDGTLASFFFDLQKSWDLWASTFSAVAVGLFNIFEAANGPANTLAGSIHHIAEDFRSWTGSTAGQTRLQRFFTESNVVLGSMARFVGQLAKDLAGLAVGGGGSAVAFFDMLRTHALPVLNQLAIQFDKGLFQRLIEFTGSFLDFIRAALPGLVPVSNALGKLVDAISGLLKVTTPLINSLPGVTKLIAAFAIGGGVLGAWSKLTDLIGLAVLRARMFVGLAPEMGGFGQIALNIARRGGRNQAAGEAGLVQVVGARGGGGFGPGVGGVAFQAPRAGRGGSGLPTIAPRSGFRFASPEDAQALLAWNREAERAQKAVEGLGRVARANEGPINGLTGLFQGAQILHTEHGNTVNGRFVSNNPTGVSTTRRSTARATLEAQSFDLTGKSGFLKFRENLGGAVNAGVGAGMRAATPLIKGAFTIGATAGIIGALSSNAHTFGDRMRDAFSTATFGFVKSSSERLSDNAKKLAQTIQAGAFTANGAGIHMSGGPISLADPRNLKGVKDIIAAMQAMGKVTKDDQTKLDAMVDAWGVGIDKVGPQAAKLKDAVARGLDLGGATAKAIDDVDNLKGAFATLAADGGKHMSKIKQDVSTNMEIIRGTLGAKSESGKLALAKNFKLAAAAVAQSMQAGAISTKTGTALIEKYLTDALMQFGLTKKQAQHYQSNPTGDISGKGAVGQPGSGQGAAVGALTRLPGQPGRDSIPMDVGGKKIVAAPGEDVAIVNRHQRKFLDKRLGDVGGFAGVFKNIRTPHSRNEVEGFASGGIVGGGGSALAKLVSAANAIDLRHFPYKWGGGHGKSFAGPYDCSGAWSAILHAAGLLNAPEVSGQFMNYGLPGPGTVTLYANPSHVYGTIKGRAWGTSGANPGGGAGWFQGGARPGFTVRHVPEQLLGALAGGIGGAIKAVKAVPGLGAVTGLAQRALDVDRAGAQSVLDKASASLFGGGSFGGGDNQEGGAPNANAALAKSMAASLFGWAGAQWNALNKLGQRESGWSTTALNSSSGAFGIGQFLGKTKEAYAKFGATSHAAGQQINAMLHYIKDRYGSPVAAWAHEQSAGWYEQGGIVPALFAAAGLDLSDKKPPIPGRGGGHPNPNPSGAVTPGSRGGSNKPGAKKKKPPHKKPPKPFAGHHPLPNVGGIKADKVKAKARKKSKAKQFYPKLHGGSEVAEALLARVVPNYDAIYENPINAAQSQLTNLAGFADLTDEEAIVTLTDSGSFADLTAFWAANPSLAQTYKDKVDSFDVANWPGMMVQGKFTPGIQAHLAELVAQLKVHTGDGSTTGQGGLVGMLNSYVASITQWGLPGATKLRDQAVSELARLHEHYDMWQGRRAHDNAELAKLSAGGRSWQQRVADNQARVKALQDYKRRVHAAAVGHRLTEADQRNLNKADQEIADLNSNSQHLRSSKPAASHRHETRKQRAARLHRMSALRNDRNEALLRLDELAGSRDGWNTNGGLAKDWTDRIATYTQSITDQSSKLADLKQNRLPAEALAVASIGKEYGDWQGTQVPLPKIDTGAAADNQQQIADLLKQQNEQLIQQLVQSQAEKAIFTGFAPLLAKSLVGVFEHGGVVPRTGLALVHQNETIIPDPRGPFGNQAAAARAEKGAGSMAVHLHGDLAGLIRLVDARIDGRAPRVIDRKLGRDGRSLHFAPGG